MYKKISIIYIYYNTPNEILDSVSSLRKRINKEKHEIIIIDNNSPLPLPNSLIKDKNIIFIKNRENKGFGRALNQASKIARGKYIIFLNPDTIVQDNFIQKIVKKMDGDKKIGLLGVRYKNKKGEVIKSVSNFPTSKRLLFSFSLIFKIFPKNKIANEYWLNEFDYSREQEVSVVGGACMVVRRDVFKKIGGFDKQFFMYFEEADLSERIRKAGYKVIYYPKITIVHLVGKSSSDKVWIRKRFEESRYKFIKKYESKLRALITESMIRYVTLTNLLVISSFFISLSLNLFSISNQMMFYGDFGRDYLAARDMLTSGNIPLRGIPSSVVWLHQGPLSIYFIGLAFLIGKFNPVAPAVLYGLMGSISVVLVYLIGKIYFNKKIGIIASFLYATSPLVVINARMPYHTSPIPFFTLIFFLILYFVLKGRKKLLPVLFFVFGLLFQLELSNSLLLLVVVISFLLYRYRISVRDVAASIMGFVFGVLPIVIHDLTHNFVQLGGFLLWTLNRVRLFLGITIDNNATTGQAGGALESIWFEISRMVFPMSQIIVALVILVALFFLIKNRNEFYLKKEYQLVILIWLIIPLAGFLVHSKPGTAYFPVVYPSVILLIAYMWYCLLRIKKVFILLFLFMLALNTSLLVRENFFLATYKSQQLPKLVGYSYGYNLHVRKDVAEAIITDAKGRPFSIRGGGFLADIRTGVDNYKYLIWYQGVEESSNSKLVYIIYENTSEVKNRAKIIYKNKYIAITKND